MSLARGAGMLCQNPKFRAFLSAEFGERLDSEKKAAKVVRDVCQVKSRAELDTNREAGRRWQQLVKEFNRSVGV